MTKLKKQSTAKLIITSLLLVSIGVHAQENMPDVAETDTEQSMQLDDSQDSDDSLEAEDVEGEMALDNESDTDSDLEEDASEEVAQTSDDPEDYPDIQEQLDSLMLPTNQAPANVSQEQLYSVQSRYNPLSGKNELGIIGSFNMTPSDYIDSKQVGVSYRYHFDDKHAAGISYTKYSNDLNASGEELLRRESLLPDYDFPNYQVDASYQYNLFYGKFRVGMKNVFYFDQYWSFGAGIIDKKSGMAPVGSIEGGLAFWMGKQVSMRVGFKNNFFQEKNLNGNRVNHDLLSQLSINILFGGNK